jgi:hypothetical protein
VGYKIIGFAVVKGAKFYLHRRYGALASRRAAAAGLVGVAIAVLAIAGARRGHEE